MEEDLNVIQCDEIFLTIERQKINITNKFLFISTNGHYSMLFDEICILNVDDMKFIIYFADAVVVVLFFWILAV